jgi:hypothetical protein
MDRRGGLPKSGCRVEPAWEGVGQGGEVDGMTILFIEGILYIVTSRIARCCKLFRVVDEIGGELFL